MQRSILNIGLMMLLPACFLSGCSAFGYAVGQSSDYRRASITNSYDLRGDNFVRIHLNSGESHFGRLIEFSWGKYLKVRVLPDEYLRILNLSGPDSLEKSLEFKPPNESTSTIGVRYEYPVMQFAWDDIESIEVIKVPKTGRNLGRTLGLLIDVPIAILVCGAIVLGLIFSGSGIWY